jgi:hypothetical protein
MDFAFYFLHIIPYITQTLQRKHLFEYQNTLTTMVDAIDITPNDTIPTLPLIPGVAPLEDAPCTGDGQNWLLTSTGIAIVEAATPQSQQCWTRMSPLNRRGK